jgi:hypothetical protein
MFCVLQVRIDAVTGLRNLMEAYDESNLEMIKPILPKLLNDLFALLTEVRVCLITGYTDILHYNDDILLIIGRIIGLVMLIDARAGGRCHRMTSWPFAADATASTNVQCL